MANEDIASLYRMLLQEGADIAEYEQLNSLKISGQNLVKLKRDYLKLHEQQERMENCLHEQTKIFSNYLRMLEACNEDTDFVQQRHEQPMAKYDFHQESEQLQPSLQEQNSAVQRQQQWQQYEAEFEKLQQKIASYRLIFQTDDREINEIKNDIANLSSENACKRLEIEAMENLLLMWQNDETRCMKEARNILQDTQRELHSQIQFDG